MDDSKSIVKSWRRHIAEYKQLTDKQQDRIMKMQNYDLSVRTMVARIGSGHEYQQALESTKDTGPSAKMPKRVWIVKYSRMHNDRHIHRTASRDSFATSRDIRCEIAYPHQRVQR